MTPEDRDPDSDIRGLVHAASPAPSAACGRVGGEGNEVALAVIDEALEEAFADMDAGDEGMPADEFLVKLRRASLSNGTATVVSLDDLTTHLDRVARGAPR